MKTLSFLLICAALAAPLRAQTIDDGIMMTAHSVQAGDVYTHDQWTEYWEGTFKRDNGNIGTLTTKTDALVVAYGVTNRLSIFGSVPWVWTNASQGVLQSQNGIEDAMFGGKFAVIDRGSRLGQLRAIVAVSGSVPLSNYTPDFAPLSIGTQSKRLSSRLTFNYQTDAGIYLNATGAYTRRADVSLDRPYYFTNNQFFLTNIVQMPNVLDGAVSVGFLKHDLNTYIGFTQHTTQGGGDIRPQDMPFVSNRVIYSQVNAMAMYPIPKINVVAFQFAAARVLDGRNVGQSTTLTFGFLYSRAAAHRRLIR